MLESVLFPTDIQRQGCHFNISLINSECRTLISLRPLCAQWRSVCAPPSNYACVMCCISQEGALLSEFAPCSLVLEHVKLSAHRSTWPICPVLHVMFHTLLSTCLPLQLHFSLCSSRTSLCRAPTINSLPASSRYLWRFLVFCISVSLYSLLPPHLS